MASQLVVIRHGETEWSSRGRHTSRTDIELTDHGRAQATALTPRLAAWTFALVLTSPRRRARETAALAGLGDQAQVDDDLRELDYGEDEGRTTPEIRAERPGWTVWDGCVDGESIAAAGARADQLLARLAAVDGVVALFGHAHFSRILTARWLELPPDGGRRFELATATLNVLGYECESTVLQRWNA